jgi:hypothetical protein
MDDFCAITVTLDQADEEILTYTVSDDALEAAARTESAGGYTRSSILVPQCCTSRFCNGDPQL